MMMIIIIIIIIIIIVRTDKVVRHFLSRGQQYAIAQTITFVA